MSGDILVDGYNVIKRNEMFQAMELKSQAEARRLLIRQLQNRYRHSTQRVVVVFDGDGSREQMSHDEHICVIFSRYDETADSVIARLTREAHAAGRVVETFTDDEEVRSSVSEQGGKVHTTRQLTSYLNAAPHDLALRAQHRQAVRRDYGLDPAHKVVDEIEDRPPPRHGKKKKKSARRRK